jgi:hypothetical protein
LKDVSAAGRLPSAPTLQTSAGCVSELAEKDDGDELLAASEADTFHGTLFDRDTSPGAEPEDLLKLVIVVDMWLTGTDIPCLHTLYIDKPMKAHNLMQAIARANRVYPGKDCGVIVEFEDPVVERLCRQIIGVWPANYNCPGQIVVSGEDPAVDECCEQAEDEGARRTVKLRVSGAFHSPLVARAAERFKPAVDLVKFHEPTAPFMSTVTAKIEPAHKMAGLLVEQLTAPVKFTQAASELAREGVKTFVEVGPGNVLSGLLRRIDKTAKAIPVNNLAGLAKLEEELAST